MSQLDPFKTLKGQGGSPGGRPVSAFEGDPNEWKRLCYWDKKHGLYLKADCLESCLVRATSSGRFRAGKRSAVEYLKSGFRLLDAMNTLVLPNNGEELKLLQKKGPEEFAQVKSIHNVPSFVKVDVVTLKATKGRQCRYRVMIPEGWRTTVRCEMLNDDVDPGKMESIFAYAGQLVGLLDYRPKYGRFVTETFTVVK